MKVVLGPGRLVVDLEAELDCLSSAVLGGGLGTARTWLNLQVPKGYARTDPAVHLAEESAGLAGPVVGMMTAAEVSAYQEAAVGAARVVATVGLGLPLAAAGARVQEAPPGTINLLAVLEVPLAAAGLAGAIQTATEAKVQALAQAGIRAANGPGCATGTASDAIAVACPPMEPAPGGAQEATAFCGPATRWGADLAAAVYQAVLAGCDVWNQCPPH